MWNKSQRNRWRFTWSQSNLDRRRRRDTDTPFPPFPLYNNGCCVWHRFTYNKNKHNTSHCCEKRNGLKSPFFEGANFQEGVIVAKILLSNDVFLDGVLDPYLLRWLGKRCSSQVKPDWFAENQARSCQVNKTRKKHGTTENNIQTSIILLMEKILLTSWGW